MKRISLCADDFAQSAAISAGILQLVAAGRLQAVSCLTESDEWPEQARRLRALDSGSQAGLHFNLTLGFDPPGQPVTRLLLRALLRRVDAATVRRRFVCQWLAFEAHYGRPPAFVDGHEHVHAFPVIRRVVIEETRRRNPAAWLRVPHAAGLMPKVLVMRALSAGLPADIGNAGLAGNARFAGFRPFHRDFDFAAYFRRLLATCGDATLVMCHPGQAADDPADPIAHCRQAELDYLLSDQYPADLAAAGVAPGALPPTSSCFRRGYRRG